MDINDLRSILTVLTVIAFVGILWWAFSSRREKTYAEAAMLPLEDDPPAPVAGRSAGQANN